MQPHLRSSKDAVDTIALSAWFQIDARTIQELGPPVETVCVDMHSASEYSTNMGMSARSTRFG